MFVYFVGSIGPGGTTPIKLALAGAATTAALSSLVSAVLLPRAQAMTEFRFWQVGGVGGADWGSMAVVVPVVTLAAVVVLLLPSSLNALALGDDVAAGLGVHVGRTRAVAAAAGVVLCAAVTSVAGPIAFVGLMVPVSHRIAAGTSHSAARCTRYDTSASNIAPIQMPMRMRRPPVDSLPRAAA